jgi:hypothetical protein
MAKRKSPDNGGLALWLKDWITILSRTESGKPAFSHLARSITSAATGEKATKRIKEAKAAVKIRRMGDKGDMGAF